MIPFSSWLGSVPAIHVFILFNSKDVDARDQARA
jgi:hypothetical protein